MELAGIAVGGSARSEFSDFDIKNTAELEAHININAAAARANFEKYYSSRLTDPARACREMKMRLNYVHLDRNRNVVIDLGTPKYDYSQIEPTYVAQVAAKSAKEQVEGNTATTTGGDGAAPAAPFPLEFIKCDYSNLDKVIKALAVSTQIPSVSLAGCKLSADEGVDVAALIAAPSTGIHILDLSGNELGAEGVEKLAPALAQSTRLRDLDLGSNDLSKAACTHLAAVLRTNRSIERLSLAGNKLGTYGLEALVQGLTGAANGADGADGGGGNHTLVALGLQNTNIGDDACEVLEKALQANGTVVHVALDGNRISEERLATVAKICAANEARLALRRCVEMEVSARALIDGDEAAEMGLLQAVSTKTRAALLSAAPQSPKPAPSKAAAGKGVVPTTAAAAPKAGAGAAKSAGKSVATAPSKAPAAAKTKSSSPTRAPAAPAAASVAKKAPQASKAPPPAGPRTGSPTKPSVVAPAAKGVMKSPAKAPSAPAAGSKKSVSPVKKR